MTKVSKTDGVVTLEPWGLKQLLSKLKLWSTSTNSVALALKSPRISYWLAARSSFSE